MVSFAKNGDLIDCANAITSYALFAQFFLNSPTQSLQEILTEEFLVYGLSKQVKQRTFTHHWGELSIFLLATHGNPVREPEFVFICNASSATVQT